MKLGFDAKRAFNNYRGLGNYSRETLRILTTMSPEYQYYLFTPRIDPNIGYECPSNAQLVTPKARGTWPQAVWRTFGTAKEAKRLQLDLYHGLSHELPYGIEKTGIRTVLTMHDLMFLSHPEFFSRFDRTMYRKKYLRSCRVADRIIAVSEQTKRDLLALTDVDPGKVEVVYQGYRPEFKQMTTPDQRRSLREKYQLPETFLLNVAALEPRKNQLLILKAMIAGKLDIPLVIAGRKTSYLKTLEAFIAQHGLERQVILLPDLPTEELHTLYQCASVFVFPSFYEGFGIPLVEALESGLPVIAATGSCLEESGGPSSIYVSPDDENELAERLRQVLEDQELREDMAFKGHLYAVRFSDQAIHQQLIQIYQNLLI